MTPKEKAIRLINLDAMRASYRAYLMLTVERIKDPQEAYDKQDLQKLCDFLNGELAGIELERQRLVQP